MQKINYQEFLLEERNQMKELSEHLNYGKKINIKLVKKYMVTDENIEFIRIFNKKANLNDSVNSSVFGEINYKRNPARHGIFKLDESVLICSDCNRPFMYFHEGCKICKRQRYKTCEDYEEKFDRFDKIKHFIRHSDIIEINDIYTVEEAYEYAKELLGYDSEYEDFEHFLSGNCEDQNFNPNSDY